jgi:hypothetical protein
MIRKKTRALMSIATPYSLEFEQLPCSQNSTINHGDCMRNKLKLVPPKKIYRNVVVDGKVLKEVVKTIDNDEGKIVNGRIYTYHPTKGWRSRAYQEKFIPNLTQALIHGRVK